MRYILLLLVALTAMPAWGADCEKALFGWTTADGTHIAGVLANEGVSAKNPRGYQNLKRDPGNFRNGRNCGGTAFGLACRNYPKLNMQTVTKAQAVKAYHDDQWAQVRGDEFKSQYLAYKALDMAINMGTGTAIILVEKTINDLNGKTKDFPLKGVLTGEMVRWLNDFTAPQKLYDGSESNWRRWCFFAQLKANALDRYGDLVAKNPKLRVFWENWSDRAEHDR